MTKDSITIKNKVKHHLSTTIAVISLPYLVYYILLFKNKLLQELWPTALLWTITLTVTFSLSILLRRATLKALPRKTTVKCFYCQRVSLAW